MGYWRISNLGAKRWNKNAEFLHIEMFQKDRIFLPSLEHPEFPSLG